MSDLWRPGRVCRELAVEWAQLMRLEAALQPADIEAAVHKLSDRSDSAAHITALESAVTHVVSGPDPVTRVTVDCSSHRTAGSQMIGHWCISERSLAC